VILSLVSASVEVWALGEGTVTIEVLAVLIGALVARLNGCFANRSWGLRFSRAVNNETF